MTRRPSRPPEPPNYSFLLLHPRSFVRSHACSAVERFCLTTIHQCCSGYPFFLFPSWCTWHRFSGHPLRPALAPVLRRALLFPVEVAHRTRFRSHRKVPGLRLSQIRRKSLRSPKITFTGLGATSFGFECPSTAGQKKKPSMNLNQLSIIGFVGQNAETKSLPNRTPVTRFSVATRRSWKGENEA